MELVWTPVSKILERMSGTGWLQVLNIGSWDPSVWMCAALFLFFVYFQMEFFPPSLARIQDELHTSDAPQRGRDGCDWSVGGEENWIYRASYYSLFCCCGLAADLYYTPLQVCSFFKQFLWFSCLRPSFYFGFHHERNFCAVVLRFLGDGDVDLSVWRNVNLNWKIAWK